MNRQKQSYAEQTACVAVAVCAAAISATAVAQHRPLFVPAPYSESDQRFFTPPPNPGGSITGSGLTGLHAAADNLVALQCPNGGWNWPYGGCANTYNNITAPIAMGLLKAYAATGNIEFRDAAVDGANFDLTGTFGYGGTAFGSFTPAFFYIVSDVTGDSTWADNVSTDFFDRLTAGTYGEAGGGCNSFYPADTYDWIERHKCARSGGLVNLRAWDIQYLPWAASLLGNADSTTPVDGVSQEEAFRDAVLDALDVLNAVDPVNDPSFFGEIIGLAGGVHSLALTGTSSFPAISAPDYAAINGVDNLCDLADVLAGLQNANGSWYWTSNASGASSEDLQTTSFAVLALAAAQNVGCGPYDAEIAAAREWIWTMQDDADGGFFSYPGGDKNIEANGEAILALGVPTTLDLVSDVCNTDGMVTVTIDVGTSAIEVVGGQFFLEYDNSVLQFVSADPGDAPFTSEVYEDVDSGAGTIDYAVGVSGGDAGTMDATTMAVLTFSTLQEVCDTGEFVSFRSNVPPTRLTDNLGNPILPWLTDLNAITIDETAPVIAVADDVQVYADAGFCSAIVDISGTQTQTFDEDPAISETQAPGVWYTDRYAPFEFVSEFFDGDDRLKHSIDASDGANNRPAGFGSDFYDTQGRKYDHPGAVSIAVDLYVPSDWATTERRMAGLWGTAFDSTSTISLYPIIEFTSLDSNPRFRVWPADPVAGGWVDLGLPTGFSYDDWSRLEITLEGGNVTYSVGDLSLTQTANGSVEFGNTILQGHNTTDGVTYDIYWDNHEFTSGANATDNCDSNPTLVGTRDDALPLGDPYPVGVTTITWTATDACGNQSMETQTIEVLGENQMVIDVEAIGLDATPIDRCITFELSGNDPTVTVSQELSFTGGAASGALVQVPCGDYDCITVRDELHTLRSSQSLAVSGTQYVADFTGAAEGLVGGDLNDDGLIDILDFGVFVWQFGVSYGSGDTTCATPYPHADISGNGTVGTEDFTFIALNFLQVDETCPGALVDLGYDDLGVNAPVRQPRERISVRELRAMQMSEFIVADLNQDGWVDAQDVAMFLQRQ